MEDKEELSLLPYFIKRETGLLAQKRKAKH